LWEKNTAECWQIQLISSLIPIAPLSISNSWQWSGSFTTPQCT
jgi:hypothetical protein